MIPATYGYNYGTLVNLQHYIWYSKYSTNTLCNYQDLQYTMEKIHRTLYKIHFKLHTLQSLQQVCGEVQHLFESHTSQFS